MSCFDYEIMFELPDKGNVSWSVFLTRPDNPVITQWTYVATLYIKLILFWSFIKEIFYHVIIMW